MTKTAKPPKPRKGFPLTAHPAGVWCKKIRGKLHYFGPWDELEAALNLYLDQRNDLQAGRKPRKTNEEINVTGALDGFLSSKDLLRKTGEITQRSYDDMVKTCRRIGQSLCGRQSEASTLPTWNVCGATCPTGSGTHYRPPRSRAN